MQIFVFNCANSRMRRFTSGVIYAGSYPNTVFKFNFNTPDWDTPSTKTVVFSCRGDNYRKPLDENNMCKVPKEVLYEGYFILSVQDDNGLLTNTIRIPVVENPGVDNIPDTDYEPDSNDINIFDGGQIMLDSTNDPDEDDNPSVPSEEGTVDYIVENKIPFYVGLTGEESLEIPYLQLDAETAHYTDQGFYTTINGGKIVNAGYQITFDGNTESIAQTFATYSTVKIVAAYQYHPTFNQWMDVGFDGTYWLEDGIMTKVINGQQITYTTYAYNVELMGDAITSPEYWRFEVEVL